MSIVLALALAQVGPLVTPGAAPPLPHQTQSEPLRPPRVRRQAQPAAPAASKPVPGRLRLCLELAETSPADAQASAASWLAGTQGADRAAAGECLGVALSRQDKWDEAKSAFLAARDAAADKALRARLGAMAGNAALAKGDAAGALAALDAARTDAPADADIALDRARALVALKRTGEAEAALAEARLAAPDNAQAWLLSATLSRRLNRLAEAQAQIEKAAALQPGDPGLGPEIGLEAGLIAVLSGRDEAARRSWRSVLATAPDSEAAAAAKGYLAQLGPAPAPVPIAPPAAKP